MLGISALALQPAYSLLLCLLTADTCGRFFSGLA